MSEFKLLSKNFIFVCLSTFLYFGSFYMLLPTIPQFVATLGGTTSQIGIVVGVYTFSSVIMRPYCGKIADTYGRKKMMILGAGFFTILFALYGQMEHIVPLYCLRAFHGIAHGIYLAAVLAYVADLAPFNRRGEVIGVHGTANVVAMALFPAWGSMIIAHTQDFSRLFLISTITAGLAFLTAFFVDEIKAPKQQNHPVSLLAVGRKPAVVVASLTFLSGATLYGAVISFLPVYAPNRGIENVGIFFTVYAIFTLISRVVAGTLSDRYGRRKVILPFMTVLAIATFLLPFLTNIFLLVLIGACFGLGFGAFMPALSAFVIDRTLPHERASALAFFTSFMDVGITAGAVVLGLVGQYWGYSTMYFVADIIVFLGILLFATCSGETDPQEITEKA